MKTIPAALQAHYDTGTTCLAYGLVIQRNDGALYCFTSHDQPLTLDLTPWGIDNSAAVFTHAQGLSASQFVTTAGFEVDNLEITALNDGELFNPDEVQAGLWKYAKWRCFRYRWDVAPVTIANDVETLARGWFGEITMNTLTVKVELRGLAQLLQQPVGIVGQRDCRARLGDALCRVNLATYTHSLTVTSVTSKQVFTATGATQAEDYFGEGLVTWLTGNNAGLEMKVKAFAVGGQFTLMLPSWLAIQVGDTFTAVAGCRKRAMEDCKTKFNNILNFQGEPHRPTVDQITAPA